MFACPSPVVLGSCWMWTNIVITKACRVVCPTATACFAFRSLVLAAQTLGVGLLHCGQYRTLGAGLLHHCQYKNMPVNCMFWPVEHGTSMRPRLGSYRTVTPIITTAAQQQRIPPLGARQSLELNLSCQCYLQPQNPVACPTQRSSLLLARLCLPALCSADKLSKLLPGQRFI